MSIRENVVFPPSVDAAHYEKGFPLLSDRPIRLASQDLLDTKKFIYRLVGPALEWPTDESLVIGIYAPWGRGKTSALNLLEEAFSEKSSRREAQVIRFNPWLYKDENSLLSSFFITLREATAVTPFLTKEKRKQLITAIDTIGGFITSTATAFPSSGWLPVAANAALATAKTALTLGEMSFDRQKAKADQILRKLERDGKPARFIVLIDDLDRAEAPEVMAMLKLVRLIADLPNITYVIAMDYSRMQEVLSSTTPPTDPSYLEKIVQIPLHLPPVSSERTKELVIDGIDSILNKQSSTSESIESKFANRLIDPKELILWRVKTLRDRARLLNVVQFLLSDTHVEIDPVDAVLISFLHVFYEPIYDRIRSSREFLVGVTHLATPDLLQQRQITLAGLVKLPPGHSGRPQFDSNPGNPYKNFFGQEAASHSVEEKRIFSVVIELFPYCHLGQQPSAIQAKAMRRANRIASPESFNHYFSFAPPANEVSGTYVEEWVAATTAHFQKHLADTTNTADDEFPEVPAEILSYLQNIEPVQRANFIDKVIDRMLDIPFDILPLYCWTIGTMAQAGVLNENDAAKFIRAALVVSMDLKKTADNPDFGLDVGDDDPGALAIDIEESAHEAFASLIESSDKVLAAVSAASEHTTLWLRREGELKGKAPLDNTLPPGLESVLMAGIERMNIYISSGKNIFKETNDAKPSYTVWRWRDLLEVEGSGFLPIQTYLRDLLKRDLSVLPDILGMFAAWSNGTIPTFARVNYMEVRQGADQVIGWFYLLRNYVRYVETGIAADTSNRKLLKEFKDLIHAHKQTSSEAN